MSTTHTPGPWEYSHEDVDLSWAIVTDAGGKIVANVNAETGPDLPPLASIKLPRDANARLIAAAPEMLAALRDVVQAYQTHFDVMPLAWQTFDEIARAAIARATGEG